MSDKVRYIGGSKDGEVETFTELRPHWRVAVEPNFNFYTIENMTNSTVMDTDVYEETYRLERLYTGTGTKTYYIYVYDKLTIEEAFERLLYLI